MAVLRDHLVAHHPSFGRKAAQWVHKLHTIPDAVVRGDYHTHRVHAHIDHQPHIPAYNARLHHLADMQSAQAPRENGNERRGVLLHYACGNDIFHPRLVAGLHPGWPGDDGMVDLPAGIYPDYRVRPRDSRQLRKFKLVGKDSTKGAHPVEHLRRSAAG